MHELQGWPGCAWVMGTNWNLAIITVLKLLIKLDMLNGVGFPLKNDLLFFYQFVEQESGRWGESFETNEKEKTWILGFVDISTKSIFPVKEENKEKVGIDDDRYMMWNGCELCRKIKPQIKPFYPKEKKSKLSSFWVYIYIYIYISFINFNFLINF
jgi:hypothetical protein